MIHEDIYNKLVFIKIKNFYSAKVEVRRQATNCENISGDIW